jgi:molybdopterin converting factor small subunit
MRINVRYFTTLQELAGTRDGGVELGEGSRLTELIETVSLKYGNAALTYLYAMESGTIDPSIKFLINGTQGWRCRGHHSAHWWRLIRSRSPSFPA